MPLTDHADDIFRSVNDDRKQIGDVAAEHTHVENCDLRERRKLSAKSDSISVLTEKDDLSLDTDGWTHTAYPAKLVGRRQRWKLKGLQNIGAEYSAIAPMSTRNDVCTHEPSPARISPERTGRVMPSSHRSHAPLMSIDAFQPFLGNNACKPAIVLGMSSFCQGQHFCRSVGDE